VRASGAGRGAEGAFAPSPAMEKAFCASGAGAGAVAVPEGMGAAPGGGGPISCASLTGPLGGKPAANRSRYLPRTPSRREAYHCQGWIDRHRATTTATAPNPNHTTYDICSTCALRISSWLLPVCT
jgi:hypothetical protein